MLLELSFKILHCTDCQETMDPKQGAGILIHTLERGNNDGCEPQRGDVVLVNYEGHLEDGSCFSAPGCMSTTVGQDHVMEGWQVALPRMELNQLVEVTIPHLYAYGEMGYPPKVPPRATLVFQMRIVEIDISKRRIRRGLWRRLLFFS